jgi:hypothetical protein
MCFATWKFLESQPMLPAGPFLLILEFALSKNLGRAHQMGFAPMETWEGEMVFEEMPHDQG